MVVIMPSSIVLKQRKHILTYKMVCERGFEKGVLSWAPRRRNGQQPKHFISTKYQNCLIFVHIRKQIDKNEHDKVFGLFASFGRNAFLWQENVRFYCDPIGWLHCFVGDVFWVRWCSNWITEFNLHFVFNELRCISISDCRTNTK